MKRAIIFYSLTNHTKEAAEHIAEATGADIYSIDTVKPMPDTMEKQMAFCGMQATFGMCPAITGMPDDIKKYDEIILGSPIWAGKTSSPVNTVLKNKDVCDRIKYVFTFSGGGDNDKCIAKLNKKLPNLKVNIALADKKNPVSSNNQEKIDKFVQEIMNG